MTNRHAGVVCGLFAAALVLGMTFGGAPQAASAAVSDTAAPAPAPVAEQTGSTPDNEAKAAALAKASAEEPSDEAVLPDENVEPLEPSEVQPETLISVSVTIQGDRIVSVQVLSQSEDEPFWTDSLVVPDRIVSAQSPDVDAVSEATSSCHGIMDAVRQALQSARNE